MSTMKKSEGKASKWVDTLLEGVDCHFWLETTDGVEREGRISGFRFRNIEVNGEEVNWPIEIEINGDSMDTIPLDRVSKLRVD